MYASRLRELGGQLGVLRTSVILLLEAEFSGRFMALSRMTLLSKSRSVPL